jgi:hypothetical protein
MLDVMKLQRNTARYEFADGIRDFQNAFWMLMMGFYVWLAWDLSAVWQPVVESARDHGSIGVLVLVMAFFSLPVILFQASLYFLNTYIRRGWLWRETGFVKPKAWIVSRSVLLRAFILLFGLSVGVAWLAIQWNMPWLIVRAPYIGTGLGIASMYFALSNQLALDRYWWLACVGAIGTLIIALLPVSAGMAGLMLGVFWAGALTTSGIYALRQVIAVQRGAADAG